MANIVHFGKYFPPDTGGIERVTASLAKGAVIAGHNVSVVCFGKTPSVEKEFFGGVRITRVPISKLLASQPLAFKYFLKCLSAAKEADIVHLHAPNMLGALCTLFTPTKTQVVVHWHSDIVNKGLLGKLVRPLEYVLLHRANSIVTTSKMYTDASKTLAPFKKKITVVPIGIPDVKHKIKYCKIPATLETKIAGRKIILSVGRLVPYKGFNLLVKAAQQLPNDSVVVIVGDGLLQQELQEFIEDDGFNERILMAGRLSDAELHALFKRATIFCIPSINRAEAFGIVILEAMAYGLPVVAFDIPGSGVPWVNQHGLSGLNMPVVNVDALANGCNQILASEDLRRKLSHGSRQRFLEEFTEETSIRRMMAVYEILLKPYKLI